MSNQQSRAAAATARRRIEKMPNANDVLRRMLRAGADVNEEMLDVFKEHFEWEEVVMIDSRMSSVLTKIEDYKNDVRRRELDDGSFALLASELHQRFDWFRVYLTLPITIVSKGQTEMTEENKQFLDAAGKHTQQTMASMHGNAATDTISKLVTEAMAQPADAPTGENDLSLENFHDIVTDAAGNADVKIDYPIIGVESIRLAEPTTEPKLNWQTSIVDLLKLLGMQSDLESRKTLARHMGYRIDPTDTALMNTWLHEKVLANLKESALSKALERWNESKSIIISTLLPVSQLAPLSTAKTLNDLVGEKERDLTRRLQDSVMYLMCNHMNAMSTIDHLYNDTVWVDLVHNDERLVAAISKLQGHKSNQGLAGLIDHPKGADTDDVIANATRVGLQYLALKKQPFVTREYTVDSGEVDETESKPVPDDLLDRSNDPQEHKRIVAEILADENKPTTLQEGNTMNNETAEVLKGTPQALKAMAGFFEKTLLKIAPERIDGTIGHATVVARNAVRHLLGRGPSTSTYMFEILDTDAWRYCVNTSADLCGLINELAAAGPEVDDARFNEFVKTLTPYFLLQVWHQHLNEVSAPLFPGKLLVNEESAATGNCLRPTPQVMAIAGTVITDMMKPGINEAKRLASVFDTPEWVKHVNEDVSIRYVLDKVKDFKNGHGTPTDHTMVNTLARCIMHYLTVVSPVVTVSAEPRSQELDAWVDFVAKGAAAIRMKNDAIKAGLYTITAINVPTKVATITVYPNKPTTSEELAITTATCDGAKHDQWLLFVCDGHAVHHLATEARKNGFIFSRHVDHRSNVATFSIYPGEIAKAETTTVSNPTLPTCRAVAEKAMMAALKPGADIRGCLLKMHRSPGWKKVVGENEQVLELVMDIAQTSVIGRTKDEALTDRLATIYQHYLLNVQAHQRRGDDTAEGTGNRESETEQLESFRHVVLADGVKYYVEDDTELLQINEAKRLLLNGIRGSMKFACNSSGLTCRTMLNWPANYKPLRLDSLVTVLSTVQLGGWMVRENTATSITRQFLMAYSYDCSVSGIEKLDDSETLITIDAKLNKAAGSFDLSVTVGGYVFTTTGVKDLN